MTLIKSPYCKADHPEIAVKGSAVAAEKSRKRTVSDRALGKPAVSAYDAATKSVSTLRIIARVPRKCDKAGDGSTGYWKGRISVEPAQNSLGADKVMAGAIQAGARRGIAQIEAAFSPRLRSRLLVILFITWMIPIHPIVAGQRLDPYRIVLIAMFFPFLIGFFARKGGRFTVPDGLIFGFLAWLVLSLVYRHGMSRFPFAVSQAIELFGGYAAGRLLIRNLSDYRRFVRIFLWSLVLLLPFVAYESISGRMMIGEVFARFFPVSTKYTEWRYGLSRVQGVFPHSILYGVYCSINTANVIFLYKDRLLGLMPRLGLVLYMTFVSLSSAAMLSVLIQIATFVWGKITRNAWWLLIFIVVSIITFLEVASNRGAVLILIQNLTLDPQTGWWRYYIWTYGLDSVVAYPFMGIGMNDWARPYWMVAVSVDSFWLLTMMRHGLPALGMLVTGLLWHVVLVVRARDLSPAASDIRRGYLIGFVGLCFTLATVHVWDVMAVLTMFYFGAASFLYTSGTIDDATPAAPLPTIAKPQPSPRAPVVYARTFDKPNHRSTAE